MDISTPSGESRWDHVGLFDMFDDGENFWFTSIEFNALFKMSKNTFAVEYIGSFPNEELYRYRLYTSINEKNGKLFFAPCSACEIGVYDMYTHRFEKINIGIAKEENDLLKIKYAKKFVSSFICNNLLILIPCCYDSTVFYNTDTGELFFKDEMFAYFHGRYGDCTTSLDSEFYLCWFAKRIKESEIVFDLHCNKNILVFYNLETGEFREQKIGGKYRTFSLIECKDKHVFLYDTATDTVIKWEIDTVACSECHIVDQVHEFHPCGVEISFVNMAVLEDWLYLIPANTNLAVKINIETMEALPVDVLSRECTIQNKEVAYLNLCNVFADRLYLWGNRSKQLIIYRKDGEVQNIQMKIPNDFRNFMAENDLADLMYKNQYWFNEEQIPLNRFMNALKKLEKEKSSKNENQDNKDIKDNGRTIYTFLIKNENR